MYTSCATSRGTSRFAHHIHEGIPTSRDFEPADIVYILAALRSQLLRLVMSFCLSIFGILQLKMLTHSLTQETRSQSYYLLRGGRVQLFFTLVHTSRHIKYFNFLSLDLFKPRLTLLLCFQQKDRQTM